jgi:hypothetical protein
MDPRCSACLHPKVEAIEDALRAGTPARKVARAYGLGRNIVNRHRAHVRGLEDAPEAAATLARGTLTERRLAAAELAFEALARAERAGRLPLVLGALRGARAASRQLRRDLEPEQLSGEERERVEALYQRTLRVLEGSRGLGSLELAALESLRASLDDLAAVAEPAPEEFVPVYIVLPNPDGTPGEPRGEPIMWPASSITPKWREERVLKIVWPDVQWRPRP